MVRRSCWILVGLGLGLVYFHLQPDLWLRQALAGRLLVSPWLGVAVFFTFPVVTHFVAGRFLCRKSVWLVTGWLSLNILLLSLNYDVYLYPAHAFGSCGIGVRAWLECTYLLPSVLGLTLAAFGSGVNRTPRRT